MDECRYTYRCQRSVVIVSSPKAVCIIARLVRHYGCDIMAFRVEEEFEL